MSIRSLPLVLSLLTLGACASAGPYSFARTYEPLDDEESYFERAQAVPFADVRRDPAGLKDTLIGWFGVVTSIGELPDGRMRIVLEQRMHQARHLCADREQDSCRVTVSERSMGSFAVDVALRPEDREGRKRVWMGSLLKIYGKPTGEFDDDGAPMLSVEHYRHFPHSSYVTTGQREGMRR